MRQISQRVNQITRPPLVEVKDVLRQMRAAGHATVDFLQSAVNVEPSVRPGEGAGETDRGGTFHNVLTNPSSGLAPLKQLIASRRQPACRQRITERNILIVAGANHGSMIAALTLWDAGDKVIVPTPYFFNAVSNLQLANLCPVYVPTSGGNGFRVSIDDLEAHWTLDTKGIVLVNPSNPTGTSLTATEADRMQELVRKHEGVLVVDESYFEFVSSSERPFNLWDMETTVLLGSFSKSHALIGHRIGYMIASEETIEAAKKVLDCTMISASTIGQHAALASLEKDWISSQIRTAAEHRRASLKKVLEDFKDVFCEVHFDCPVFAFIKVEPRIGATKMCDLLLQQGVGIGKGAWFGEEYNDYIRICCCNPSTQDFDMGLEKIIDCCTKRKRYAERLYPSGS